MAATSGDREDRDRLITIADYERMPEEDMYRVELVRGLLVRSPRPAPLHGALMVRMARRLDEFVERAGGGVVLADVGAILARDPDTVRGPDVAFYSTERIPESGYSGGFWGPPDLAVEIVSPSNRPADVREKVTDYLAAGVRLVWVIDPRARSVTVHRSGSGPSVITGGAVLDGGDVLPALRLPLADLFTL